MADNGFVAYVLELLEPLGGCSAHAMFGGHGIYRDGGIFGLIIDDRLYLKADAQTAAEFTDAGSAAFVYQGKGRAVQMSYWSLPDDALESSGEMIRWARLALAAAARKAATKSRRLASDTREVPARPPTAKNPAATKKPAPRERRKR